MVKSYRRAILEERLSNLVTCGKVWAVEWVPDGCGAPNERCWWVSLTGHDNVLQHRAYCQSCLRDKLGFPIW